MNLECITNIVGILKNEDCCLVELTPIVSLSGLYVDDTTAGRIPLTPAFYKDYELYERLIPDAISEAVNVTRQKLETNLIKKYRQHHSIIGFRDDWTDFVQSTLDWYYSALKPYMYSGPTMRLNKITIYTESGKHTGNIIIYVDGVEVYNGLLSEYKPMNFELKETIYIAYKGDRPRNFKHRGCCGKNGTYQNWINVGSGIAGAPENFVFKETDFSNGIELDVVFDCDAFGSHFCNIDFRNNGFGYAFASLVQLIARKNLAYYILTNDKVTSYLLVSKEEINGIIEYLSNEIERTLNYLPQAYNHSDCFICNGLYKSQILV